MTDLNLINKIIYVDLSIESLKWVLKLKLAIIRWGGFILKPWSFLLLSSEKEKQGNINEDLILILN